MITALLAIYLGSSAIAQSQDGLDRLATEADSAMQRAASGVLEPHEMRMIEYRRALMGQPGLQFYVVFFNKMGQPIDYFVTDGKCTSSGKRLLQSWKFQEGQTGVNGDGAAVYGDFVLPAAALDGTYGGSDNYIYCKTADGKYKQWNGLYYASDAPIELTIKPLISDSGGAVQGQQ